MLRDRAALRRNPNFWKPSKTPITVPTGLGRFGSRAKPDSQTAKAAGNTRPSAFLRKAELRCAAMRLETACLDADARLRGARIQIDAMLQVVGTKVITKRLAVNLLMRLPTGQPRCATPGVPFSRAALSNKDVWRLLLRATLSVAAILLLAFGGAPR